MTKEVRTPGPDHPIPIKKENVMPKTTPEQNKTIVLEAFESKRPSNTPVGGIVFVMNSGHERGCWSVGWSS